MTISDDMCRLWWLLRQVKGPLWGRQERIKWHQAKTWTLKVAPKLLRSADSSDWPGWSDSGSSDDEKCNDYLPRLMKSWTLKEASKDFLVIVPMMKIATITWPGWSDGEGRHPCISRFDRAYMSHNPHNRWWCTFYKYAEREILFFCPFWPSLRTFWCTFYYPE